MHQWHYALDAIAASPSGPSPWRLIKKRLTANSWAVSHTRLCKPCHEFYEFLPDLTPQEQKEQCRQFPAAKPEARLNPPRRGPKLHEHGVPTTETLQPWIFRPDTTTTCA
eukprot:4992440-Amphidinium_carterae.2